MCQTRDRTCQTEVALPPECAGNTRSHVSEQEIVLLRVRGDARDRTCQNRVALLRVRGGTRDRTCQNRRSYFSEYAVRHEIARVKSQLVLLPEYADNTSLHVSGINGVRQQSAGNTTDDAEWMRNDAALFLMG